MLTRPLLVISKVYGVTKGITWPWVMSSEKRKRNKALTLSNIMRDHTIKNLKKKKKKKAGQ